MLKKTVPQGRRRVETGGVPLGYVEDFDEPRTKLGSLFSRRLRPFEHNGVKIRLRHRVRETQLT